MSTPGAFARHFKCNCCTNPWNNADNGDFMSSLVCGDCLTKDGNRGIDIENFDHEVDLKEDFYLWVNGNWKKNNPLPAAYPRWGSFNVLNNANQERLKDILSDLEDGKIASTGKEIEMLINFHKTYLDTDKIDAEKINPLSSLLELIIKDLPITEKLAFLSRDFGLQILFGIYAMPDKSNSEHTLANIGASGLGLPDRDYYFDADKAEARDQYLVYIEDLFKILVDHAEEEDCTLGEEVKTFLLTLKSIGFRRKMAKFIFDFESDFAASMMTRTEKRDPVKTHNTMSLEELQKMIIPTPSWSSYLAKGIPVESPFDFSKYFEIVTDGYDMGAINVSDCGAIKKMASMCQAHIANNNGMWRYYLLFHIVNKVAPYMNTNTLEAANFNFQQKQLLGTKELKERWKRALDLEDSLLGDILGKIYVEKHFPSRLKDRCMSIVNMVKESLRERLNEIEWMSTNTRSAAIKKMDKFNVKIGFPEDDAWEDYSALVEKGVITSDSPCVCNILSIKASQFIQELLRCNKATERKRWLMRPQQVNAYYHPMLNEIVFPAAILQPPFFSEDADDAVNFGSMGAVVGHEMTHGFDDSGAQYDYKGSLQNWWEEADKEEFKKRANVMIEQANQHEVQGLYLKGAFTQGENIADLGGLKLSLRALKKHLAANPQEPINGFTAIQRFFISWAQVWRQNCSEPYAKSMLTLDPHGPSELRCNNTVANIQEFIEAFDVKEDDKMGKYIDKTKQVDVW